MNTTFTNSELGSSYLLKPDPPTLRTFYQITRNFTEVSAQDLSGNAEQWGNMRVHKTILFYFWSFFHRTLVQRGRGPKCPSLFHCRDVGDKQKYWLASVKAEKYLSHSPAKFHMCTRQRALHSSCSQ